MPIAYEADIAAWADEQARLIRAGQFDQLDLLHLADEIEDVGKSERRELVSRMAVLLAHLLKYQHQPERRSGSWDRTIREQRKAVLLALDETPSLRPMLTSDHWTARMWSDAVTQAIGETGLDDFPDICPWAMDEVLRDGWMPT